MFKIITAKNISTFIHFANLLSCLSFSLHCQVFSNRLLIKVSLFSNRVLMEVSLFLNRLLMKVSLFSTVSWFSNRLLIKVSNRCILHVCHRKYLVAVLVIESVTIIKVLRSCYSVRLGPTMGTGD